MGKDPADHELAAWLAEQSHVDAEQIAAELALGERRREFVADELVEAGFVGPELLDLVMRLTGTDKHGAQALLAARGELKRAGSSLPEVPKRDRALAQNEILFRELNERLAARGDSPPDELDLICECSDRECLQPLVIEVGEYEWLRQNPHRFAVLPGHEAPAVEDVVERHDRFLVVEKHPETYAQVEAADPRI